MTLSEFGFWVALGLPGTEGIKDGQADSENGDADEDLSTAMCCFGARLAGGSKNQDQSERIQGVKAPVCLVLPEREQERRPGKYVDCPGGQRGDRHGYYGDDPERGADRLFPYPLSLVHQDEDNED